MFILGKLRRQTASTINNEIVFLGATCLKKCFLIIGLLFCVLSSQAFAENFSINSTAPSLVNRNAAFTFIVGIRYSSLQYSISGKVTIKNGKKVVYEQTLESKDFAGHGKYNYQFSVPGISDVGNYKLIIDLYNAKNKVVVSKTTDLTVKGSAITVQSNLSYWLVVNQPVSSQIVASNGNAPYKFITLSSNGPLSLSSSGEITGTPTQSGYYSLSYEVTDSASPSGYTTNRFNYEVYDAPSLTTETLTNGIVGSAYSFKFASKNGYGALTYSASNLPQGLSMSSNGVLSGTPESPVKNHQITVTVKDKLNATATKDFSLTIDTAPLVMNDLSVGHYAEVGKAFSYTYSASGGVKPYTYKAASLPNGLSLDTSTGVLSGTPTLKGESTVSVTVTDKENNTATANLKIQITADNSSISLTTESLDAGVVGKSYSQQLAASGGSGTFSYGISSGAPPDGLTLSSDGLLSGTPTKNGSYTVTIVAEDANQLSAHKTYTLNITGAALTIDTDSNLLATVGQAFSQNLSTSGGQAPYTYTNVSGSMDGLTLSPSGLLSGTPAAKGTFTFTLESTDVNNNTVSKVFTLEVDEISANMTITPTSLENGHVGQNYSTNITADGGQSPYHYAVVSGTLPTGITLSRSGLLSGAPANIGTYVFSIEAADDSKSSAIQTYSWKIDTADSNITLTQQEQVEPDSSATVDLTQGAVGTFTSAAIVSVSPSSAGTATISGTKMLFKASSTAGVAKVLYTLTDSSGKTVNGLAVMTVAAETIHANDMYLSVEPGKTLSIDLTQGATGGPFASAAVLSMSPTNAGNVTVNTAAQTLNFVSASTWTGQAVIAYSLSNASGVADVGHIYVTSVANNRPDPTQNADVMGIVAAQTAAVQQFVSSQLSNVSQRMESLHDNGFGESSFGLSFNQELSGSEALAQDTESWQPKRDGDATIKNAWQSDLSKVSLSSQQNKADSAAISTLPDLPVQQDEKQRALAFWISGVVDYGKQSQSAQHASYKLTTTGISLGADYRWTKWLTVGAGLGYANSHSDIGDNGSTNKSQSTMLMLYDSLRPYKKLYIDSVIGIGNLDFNTQRYDEDSGSFAYGSRNGHLAFGSVAVGWDFVHDNWLISPYTRFDYSMATLNAYQEMGVDVDNLYYYDQKVHNSSINYGIRSEGKIDTRFGEWHPVARIEYQNQVSGQGDTRLSYADELGVGPVYSVRNSSNSFGNWTVSLGSKLILQNHVELMLDYAHNINVSLGQYQSLRFTVRIPM